MEKALRNAYGFYDALTSDIQDRLKGSGTYVASYFEGPSTWLPQWLLKAIGPDFVFWLYGFAALAVSGLLWWGYSHPTTRKAGNIVA